MKLRYYFTIAKLAFMVLLPVVLLILPGNVFDSGESICLSTLLFDFECYACGLTRACQHLIHLEFEEAYSYHMLSFVIFPMVCILWIQWFIKEWKMFNLLRFATPIDSIL